MKKFICLFIAASLIVLPGAALATDKTVADQNTTEKGKRRKSSEHHLKFEDCDKENKGALTFEEAQTCFPRMSREKFDAIDTNKDGAITKAEIKAHRAAKKKHKKDKPLAD